MGAPLLSGGTIEPKIDASGASELAAVCLIVAVDGARVLAPPSRQWLIDVDEVLCSRRP